MHFCKNKSAILQNMARDKNIQLLLDVIRRYFEPMRDDRGKMRRWCLDNKIGQWNLSRILQNDPNYEPKMRIINQFLKGMFGYPPIEIRESLIDKDGDMSKSDLIREFAKGLSGVSMPDVQTIHQLINVLSYKNLLDQQYSQFLETLLSLLATIHAEIVIKRAEKDNPPGDFPLSINLSSPH